MEQNRKLTNQEEINEIIALRNQLLNEVKKSVEHNEKTDMIRMKRKDYDILIRDWERTTQKWEELQTEHEVWKRES